MNKNELAAKVKAYNRCIDYAKIVNDKMQEFFAGYVGKKVLKADGSLLLAVKELLPKFNNLPVNVQIYKHNSDYSLGWTVKTWEQVEGACGCVYQEIPVYVARLDNAIIKNLYAPINLPDYYTVEQVENLLAEREKIQHDLSEVNSALGPFRD